MTHAALKGFQCVAVYDRPQTEAPEQKSKSSKKHAAASSSASSPSSSSSSSSPLVRYLYYKSHSGSSNDDSVKEGCTLFVVNIPFHYTEEHLTQLFSCFGSVEQVNFLQSPPLQLNFDISAIGAVESSAFYRSAHVVYEEEESVQMAMKTDLSQTPQPCPEEEEDSQHVGVKAWLASYHSTHPQVASLQMQVDRFMEGFDQRTAAEKAEARKGPTVDSDGWTLVKSNTRNKKKEMLQMEEETERAQERADKKAKKNQVLHFYKHQEREAKKERLIQLREKFEQDKLKIAKMKQDRKFKPY